MYSYIECKPAEYCRRQTLDVKLRRSINAVNFTSSTEELNKYFGAIQKLIDERINQGFFDVSFTTSTDFKFPPIMPMDLDINKVHDVFIDMGFKCTVVRHSNHFVVSISWE